MSLPMLWLASASPRRRELLALLGVPFEIMPSDFDEDSISTLGLSPGEWTMGLAEGKARAACLSIPSRAVVIGADTTVVLDGTYLNKPAGDDDARRMLHQLSGRTHTVCTGVCVLETQNGEVVRAAGDFAQTLVTFDTLPGAVIDAYVAGGEPRDKAGAYGIQGDALHFIPTIDGDYFNVVGLPLALLGGLLLPYFPHISPPPPQPTFPDARYGR